MKTKTCKVLIIVAFFIMLIVPVLFADKAGGALSVVENRNLEKFPVLLDDDNRLNPVFKKEFELWLNDNLWGRMEAQKLKAWVDIKLFSVSPSPKVQIGKDDWLFYVPDNNLEIGEGMHYLSEEELENLKINQLSIQQSLKNQGIDYVLVLIPSKASVYPEKIKGGDFTVGSTLIDQASAYLEEATTIPVINLKPELLDEKERRSVYFRNDTHWNETGAYIGYEIIINRLNDLGFVDTEPIKITMKSDIRLNPDLSVIMGYNDLFSPELVDYVVFGDQQAKPISSDSDTKQMKVILENLNIPDGHYSFSNDTADKSILIFGDSFFENWRIPEMFAENFARTDFIRTYTFSEDFVNDVKPDLVIVEVTERYIHALAKSDNLIVSDPPLEHLSAKIILKDPQTTLGKSTESATEIVVENTGVDTWSASQGFFLCVGYVDNNCSYQIYLPENFTVKPSQEYTFAFNGSELISKGSGNLKVQMHKGLEQAFGEIVSIDVKLD